MSALVMPAMYAMPPLPAFTRVTPTLWRSLLLALLLHLWLLLLLGSAPGGSARLGEGVWGAINVTLRGPPTPGATATVLPTPLPQPGPPGAAASPRSGGAVREAEHTPQAEPGAAQLGDWARRAPPAPAPPIDAGVAPRLAAPAMPAAPPAIQPPPGRVVEERAAPALLPMAPAPAPTLSPPLSALPATPAAAPLALPAPAPSLQGAPAAAERQLNSPLARPAPEIRPLAETAPLPGAQPLPTTLQAPAALAAPALAEPPLRQLSAPPSALDSTTAAQPAPALAPVPPAAAITPAASPAPALSRVAPATTVAPAAIAAPLAPGPAATPGVPDGGAPDAGPRVGHDVATPPAPAASAPTRLNLELARPRGGALSRGAATGMLPLLPRPPETMDKLGRDIQNAAKPDCRDAHASKGLLAVVPLAVDALRKEGGCKW